MPIRIEVWKRRMILQTIRVGSNSATIRNRRLLKFTTATFLLIVMLSVRSGFAQEQARDNTEQPASETGRVTLKVGTKQSPPFAMKNSDGTWTGISIELWKHLASELELEYQFEELTLDEMLTRLQQGELDAAVAAISVTADRHERIEFCHPHYSTGLGIATSTRDRSSLWSLIRRVVSSRLLLFVFTLIGIVAICGFLFWIFERNHNLSMFGGKRREGIGMGLWWSTTLLLGNKGVVPASSMGRVLAGLAMLSSIIVVSTLTGVITSVLTVQQLDSSISRVSDLDDVRVATVNSSTSAEFLRQRRVLFHGYDTPEEAIRAVDHGEADAVV